MLPSVAVTVVVDASIRDFVRSQRFHKLVVSVDKAPNPVIRLDVLDVVQDLPTQILASLEAADNFLVFRYTLCLSIDQLEAIEQVCRCDGGLGEGSGHVLLFTGQIEGLALGLVGFAALGKLREAGVVGSGTQSDRSA